jgi:Leucine-rich repeat (LRR) protein
MSTVCTKYTEPIETTMTETSCTVGKDTLGKDTLGKDTLGKDTFDNEKYEEGGLDISDQLVATKLQNCMNSLSKQLKLEYLGLEDVPVEIKSMTHLLTLSLKGNRIKLINASQFPKSLRILILDNNKIEVLNDESIPCGLTNLSINHNNISEFDGKSMVFSNLSSISISDNRLSNVILPTNIKYAMLTHNSIETIGDFPKSLVNIQLFDNKLAELPIINNGLSIIDVSQNDLEYFSEFPYSVTELYISHNSIRKIDKELPPYLKTFKAYASRISEISVNLSKSLTDIDLSNNNLYMMPELPSTLTHLNLNDNNFTELPTIPNSIKELDVSQNRLTELPTELLERGGVNVKYDGNFIDSDDIKCKFPGNGRVVGDPSSSTSYMGNTPLPTYSQYAHNANSKAGVNYNGQYSSTGNGDKWNSNTATHWKVNNMHNKNWHTQYERSENNDYTSTHTVYTSNNAYKHKVKQDASQFYATKRAHNKNPHYVSRLWESELIILQ